MAADLPTRYYREQQSLVRSAANAAQRTWRQLDSTDLTGSWNADVADTLVATVVAAQTEAAALAQAYVRASAVQAGSTAAPTGQLIAPAFAGLAVDGRPLATLLRLALAWALRQLRLGAPPSRARASGLDRLLLYVTTEITDTSRIAVQIAMALEPGITGYERVVVPPACGRCLILAGRVYRYSTGFLRHPQCDCQMRPVTADQAGREPTATPRALFEAMSREQQDKALGKAGAEAVRAGADMAQVVNARRGMYVAGGRRFTREGTTRRGLAGQRHSGPRPMPSELLSSATSRRDLTDNLRRYGYIT